MRKIISKPHYFFVFLAVITLLCGVLNKDAVIPFAFYGTIIDIDITTVTVFSVLFFVLISVNYASLKIIKKPVKKGLTLAHIILQTIALIPYYYFIFQSDIPRTYEEVNAINSILLVAFVVFLIATIIHLINFLLSLLAKKD